MQSAIDNPTQQSVKVDRRATHSALYRKGDPRLAVNIPLEQRIRCEGFRRRVRDPVTGERVRCKKWRVNGHKLCREHLLRSQGRLRLNLKNGYRQKRKYYPVAISKYLSDTLQERIAELNAGSPLDKFDMSADFPVAMQTLIDAAQIYDATFQTNNIEARIAAGQVFRETYKEVADLGANTVDLMTKCRAYIGVQNIPLLVNQFIDAAYEVFGDDERVREWAEKIKNIRLPNENAGTLLTPDMDVKEMDSTVPKG
jgi:hypothetical protein